MEEKFINYIMNHDVFEDASDTDFSDPAFAYDYNEVQELYFDGTQNNYVFLTGETGLRKTDMLGRICRDLLLRGIEKEQILYLDYELPFLVLICRLVEKNVSGRQIALLIFYATVYI